MSTELTTVGTNAWAQMPFLHKLRDYLRFASFFVNPSRRRVDVLYDMISTRNYFTERTLFRNLGYWKDSPATLDDACEAMAQLAGETAALGPADRVLDAGFGFADQDMYWIDHFNPREIVGINVTQSQVDLARERVAERGLSERIVLQRASATQLSFEANSFDKVIALESAFHFDTREDFFREAFRVLRPGGRLVALDMIPKPDQKVGFWARAGSDLGFRLWQTSSKNLYEQPIYIDKLLKIGFERADVKTIYDDVVVPFAHFVVAQMAKPEIASRFNPLVAWMFQSPASGVVNNNPHGGIVLDYVLAVADKPARAAPNT